MRTSDVKVRDSTPTLDARAVNQIEPQLFMVRNWTSSTLRSELCGGAVPIPWSFLMDAIFTARGGKSACSLRGIICR